MESGLFRDFFGNFSTRGESYYFCVEGSTRGVFETSENSKLGKTQISFLGGGEHWWVWQGVGVQIRSWGRMWGSGIDHGSRVWGWVT